MGQLVDERLAETEEEISSINEETVIQEQDPVETQESLPDKYQGKSTAEIVQMHQEAEKLLGRQSSEVGELRKVVDTYIQGQTQLDQGNKALATVVQDAKFQEWVSASKVRQQLFQQADKLYDYETADELLNLWKDRQRAVQQTANSEKLDRKQTIKNASVGTNKGSSAPSSKKIYRRADIINLMKDDPRRYLALADEITQAYAEKRVR